MNGIMRMKVDGSGSAKPIRELHPSWVMDYTVPSLANALYNSDGWDPVALVQAGFPVFYYSREETGDGHAQVAIPDGADSLAWQSLEEWGEEHGVDAAGQARILAAIRAASGGSGQYWCQPRLAQFRVLHAKATRRLCCSPNGRLRLVVAKHYYGPVLQGVDPKVEVGLEFAMRPGTNACAQFLHRASEAGADAAGNPAASVPPDAEAHPWPEATGQGGASLGLIPLYAPDASGSPSAVGPAYPLDAAPTILGLFHEMARASADGLIPTDVPYVAAKNIDPDDPAAWFRALPSHGAPGMDAALQAFLPTPNEQTGPYRPGLYYLGSRCVYARSAPTEGLVDALPAVPFTAADNATHTAVTTPLTLAPAFPDDFPGDWCAKNGDAPQRPADWAQRHVPILWHWHESCEGIDFTLRVSLFTGDGTKPLPKDASAYVAFCANSYDPITPQGNAPQPEILSTPYVGHGIYATILRIPLAGLFEDDGQHLLPWQTRTLAYKGSGPGPFAFYLGSATGSFDGPATPILPATLTFHRHAPYPLHSQTP